MDNMITSMLIDTILLKSLCWADNILNTENHLLSEIKKYLNITSDESEYNKQVIECLNERIQGNFERKRYKEIQRIENLLIAITIKNISGIIDLTKANSTIYDNFHLIYRVYELGVAEGYRQALNDVRPNWPILKKNFCIASYAVGTRDKGHPGKTRII